MASSSSSSSSSSSVWREHAVMGKSTDMGFAYQVECHCKMRGGCARIRCGVASKLNAALQCECVALARDVPPLCPPLKPFTLPSHVSSTWPTGTCQARAFFLVWACFRFRKSHAYVISRGRYNGLNVQRVHMYASRYQIPKWSENNVGDKDVYVQPCFVHAK